MPSKLSAITVRMTGELHQRLKADAIAESVRLGRVVSLNALCVERLKLYQGLRDDLHETQEDRDRLLRKCRLAGLEE